jgi:hypothetical protein
MDRHFVGKFYRSDSNFDETKDSIKKDIDAEIEDGNLPKIKFTIKKKYFAGGRELIVTIRKSPVELLNDNGSETEEYKKIKNKITEISNNYNFLDEDMMSDYLSTDFFFRINLSNEFYAHNNR